MQNPFRYRPPEYDDFGNPIPEDEFLGWEDNPVSNAMAWASDTLMPSACQAEDGYMVKLVIYLWADCSCCLFWRGAVLGSLVTLALAVTASLIF